MGIMDGRCGRALFVVMFGMVAAWPCQFALAAPTEEDCDNAWENSPASQTCQASTVGEDSGQCEVEAQCGMATLFATQYQAWSGSQEDMSNLQNCNGALTVGSC